MVRLKDNDRGFFLAVNGKVSEGDYQWAYTGSQNYINSETKYKGGDLFQIRPDGFGQYLIVSNHGV